MAYRLVERPCAPPLNARSMERLGSPFGWGSTVDDLEALADDWHSRAWHSSNAFAYSSEVCPMDFAPIAQRSIAFALGSGKLLTDFLEGNSRHCLGFDDTQRLTLPVCHDAKVARLGRWPVFRFEGPRQPSSRSLRSDKNEPYELICSWFVVVEVEGLVEAGLNITSDDGLKLEPEGLNGVGDGH